MVRQLGGRREVSKAMTLGGLLALPLMVDIRTAARALGLSRSKGYELARRNEFPCRVLHVSSSYRVPTVELLRVLGQVPVVRRHGDDHLRRRHRAFGIRHAAQRTGGQFASAAPPRSS